jgi:heme exporter protein B
MSRAFYLLVRRDLLLAVRNRAEIANPLLFFVLVVSLFPLGVGPESAELRSLAPGVIWVAALLAALLSLDGIFRSDFEDGTLEQMLLSHHPVWVLVLAKIVAHWLVTGLPVILVSPVLGVLMFLPADSIGVLVLTLLLGTPFLSLVGAIGVALTVGLHRGGVLLSLLVIPLYVPVLIFSSNAVETAAVGIPITAQLYFLGALLAGALTLAPLATAAALRISLS